MESISSLYEKLPSFEALTSLLYPAPIPPAAAAPSVMGWKDWALVGVGLVAGMGLVFGALFFSAGRDKSLQSRVLTKTNFWLVLSGVIHLWIEGSFVFNRNTSPIKPGLDYYASGDLRYGSPMEAGTAAMEAITSVLEGPLCWAVAYGAIHGKAWRFPWQLVLCTAQIYGLIWFILHPAFSSGGYKEHLTSDPFLFWFLVVGMNAPWAIFPVALWWEAYFAIVSAMGGAAPVKPDCKATTITNGSSSSAGVQPSPASMAKRRSRKQA